ncbi:MAG: Gfo/Idh/MocA family oxidoreductase [Anaerolineae bacterium]|nr:Gfo/Idh/MocA family oxidoreductase [Anaerolineae bacterium]
MADEQVRWGVLGAARIAGKAVLPAIVRAHNGAPHALASRDVARARDFATQFDIPKVYERYDEVIADPDVQAVYIPLPNHLHREWTLRAVRAGKHVLCEKPLALDALQAQEMADAAHQAGVLLMEAFMYRFHPRSQRVKALVEAGAVGDPRLIRAAFCFFLNRPDDIRLRPEYGGGALMDVGCYGVSLARWMFGAEPEIVQASAEYGRRGVDVSFAGLLRFADARLAVVEASFATARQESYTIAGSAGLIDIPDNDAFVVFDEETRFRLQRVGDAQAQVETVAGGAHEYQLMVEHFGEAALGRAALAFPPEDAVANMRVLDALAQAARDNHPVTVGD